MAELDETIIDIDGIIKFKETELADNLRKSLELKKNLSVNPSKVYERIKQDAIWDNPGEEMFVAKYLSHRNPAISALAMCKLNSFNLNEELKKLRSQRLLYMEDKKYVNVSSSELYSMIYQLGDNDEKEYAEIKHIRKEMQQRVKKIHENSKIRNDRNLQTQVFFDTRVSQMKDEIKKKVLRISDQIDQDDIEMKRHYLKAKSTSMFLC